jgi:hypothetical protein
VTAAAHHETLETQGQSMLDLAASAQEFEATDKTDGE